MSAPVVLLATRSAGKLRELRPLLAAGGFTIVDLAVAGLPPLDEENEIEQFETFEENALAKARYFHTRSGGIPTIADDSGLEVSALGGGPGVRSRRWSGRDDLDGEALDAANNDLLRRSLASDSNRAARYVCVAAWVDDSHECSARGETTGLIVDSPRGGAGFGYDPYFFSLEAGKTFGELGVDEKELLSHRGRAFRALMAEIVTRR